MADCLTLIIVRSFSVDAFLFIIIFVDVMDFGLSLLLSGPCLPVVHVPMCLDFFCILICDMRCSVFHHVSPEHTRPNKCRGMGPLHLFQAKLSPAPAALPELVCLLRIGLKTEAVDVEL
ncbi:hypothetical protein EDD17DRAFT_51214 [Pisolithus thermaeus]|nr:hypothetical protein EDD17DRAFT_51214 [Pisolithus thermaeus]